MSQAAKTLIKKLKKLDGATLLALSLSTNQLALDKLGEARYEELLRELEAKLE